MSEGIQPDAAVEQGKAAILQHIQDLMMSSGVDLKLIVFKWQHGTIYHRWILRVFRGKSSFVLKFTERDVVAWPRYPEVAGKYEAGTRDLIERLKER
jgi:hypothetical protein